MPPNKVIPMTGAAIYVLHTVLGYGDLHTIEYQPTWPILAPPMSYGTVTHTTSGPGYYTR